ncbi:MAG: threonine synthase [Candidatus Eremiobacteraeota bacterium]|nr:threonine synthase [Candidatus Eremiobacteraeota bacterium]MBV8355316.1 threonine synthase [Candidatus Eremiobacteraeota bacterium]
MLPAGLDCSRDPAHRFSVDGLASTCPHDGAPLLVRYRNAHLDRTELARRPWTMWRYREMLPVAEDEEPISLGEGATPLVPLPRIAAALGVNELFVKDEAQNPTASFKSRGMSVAVTVAARLGARALVAPSAGNAGGALAAYGARAGIRVRVYVPRDTPAVLVEEMRSFGAEVELIDGLIDECGRLAAAHAAETGAFNVATLREPYRIEGKKTMGYELVEQFGKVPGTIVYPTGGGTGLVGMWKAFDELQTLGWIADERPAMISVQAEGCAPIVRAFEAGAETATRVENAQTAAWGLRVPAALGDRLILTALRASGGRAVAVSEAAMLGAMTDLRQTEGIDASEEGGATLAALRTLTDAGVGLRPPVVLFNTGSALKYAPRMPA